MSGSLPVLAAVALFAGCAAARPPAEGRPLPAAEARTEDGSGAEGGPAVLLEERLAAGVSWPVLLEAVLERSPEVAAARSRWEAALEEYPRAVALPDPMVEFRWYTNNAMNPGGAQRVDTMVRQALPNPVSLSLKGDLALRDAEMARLAYDAALRDAVVELRDAFEELAYLDRARTVVRTQQGILARYATVAAGDLEEGRSKFPDEIRARSLLAQAGYDLVLLEDLRRTEEQRLRGILALAPGSPLGPVTGAEGTPPLALPLDEVLRLAGSRSQEIAMAGVALRRADVETSMARWEYAPDFEIGGAWDRNMMRDPAGDVRSSRAILFGLSVPLWAGAKSARVRETRALAAAAGADRQAAVERVRTGATRLYFRIVNAERLETLYRDTLLPQAEESQRLAEALYREGRGSLAGAIETAVAVENIRLARLRAATDHAQAVARLEQVVGAVVTVPTAAPEGGDR